MKCKIKSIRPFIGAKDYELSRNFYLDLGFKENVLSPTLCYFSMGEFGFYLQNAYVTAWVDNTMLFMEVDDVSSFWNELIAMKITLKYEMVRLVPISELDWGKECFLHDPSGILWHFGEFKT